MTFMTSHVIDSFFRSFRGAATICGATQNLAIRIESCFPSAMMRGASIAFPCTQLFLKSYCRIHIVFCLKRE
jgi:hypothetical protein